MLKIIIIFFLLFLLSLYIFINLGNFVDNTQKPIKSDIIVSLGGEAGCHLQEALKLRQFKSITQFHLNQAANFLATSVKNTSYGVL